VITHQTWMGGSRPRPINQVTGAERRYITTLFKEQCRIFRNFWGDLPKDMRRLFFNRARYDAHATFRNEHDKTSGFR